MPEETGAAAPPPEAAAFEALRARGVDRRDPVRFRLAEALARRASAHAGGARRVLDARLASLLDELSAVADAQVDDAAPRPSQGLLAGLVAHAARHKPAPGLSTTARDGVAHKPASGPAADPKTLQFFKRTWSRLSADQRLAQSRASLPDNAGPLNSQHLVHRALTAMQSLSPQYLEHFVAYIDALQWLEQSNEAAEDAVGMKTAAPRRSAALRR